MDAWAKFGIKLYPSGGRNAWNKREDGFPTNCPDLVPNDQALHNEFKHFEGMFYDQWNSTKPSKQTAGRFFNLIQKIMEDLPQTSVQKAIDTQRSVCKEVIRLKGKATKYLHNHPSQK